MSDTDLTQLRKDFSEGDWLNVNTWCGQRIVRLLTIAEERAVHLEQMNTLHEKLRSLEPPDEWMFDLLQAQHSSVPEDQRPHSWSDLNDEQLIRFKAAAKRAWDTCVIGTMERAGRNIEELNTRALAAKADAKRWNDEWRACQQEVFDVQAERDRLREGAERWLSKYTPTDDFGCACTPNRTCGTCQWRERTAELRAALASGAAEGKS